MVRVSGHAFTMIWIAEVGERRVSCGPLISLSATWNLLAGSSYIMMGLVKLSAAGKLMRGLGEKDEVERMGA